MLKKSWHQIKITLIAIVGFFSVVTGANADSPLTSTNLATAYQDLAIIQQAQNTKRLQGELLNFLLSDAPLDEKAALINALGWNFDGQNNGYLFLIGLANSKSMTIDEITLNDLTADNKFVLGYLLAMDDYFKLSPLRANASEALWRATPLEFLSQAAFALPDNFTVHFVKSLIEAQKNMDNSWCAVYQAPQSVLKQFPENRNLRPLAVETAMSYLNGYQEYCNNAESTQNKPELNQIYQIIGFQGNIVTATQGGVVIWNQETKKTITVKEDAICSNMQIWNNGLWIGCQHRLWRYDGTNWTSYLHNPKYSEGSYQLLVNPQNQLLVTYKDKLLRYNAKLDNFVPDSQLFSIKSEYHSIYRQNGEFWQIDFLNAITQNSRRFPIKSQLYQGSDPRAFYEDEQGNLWVIDFEDGFYRFDDNKKEFIRFPEIANQGSDLVVDSQNNIIYFLHYRDGLYIKKDNQKIEFIDLSFLEYMRDIYLDEKGNLWVAGWNQLLKLTPHNNTWKKDYFKL